VEFLIGDIFYGCIGWLYLLLKYRSIEKVRFFVKKEYKGSYSMVGLEQSLKLFALIGAVLIFLMILAVFYSIFKI
jgi:hypothetical protein